MNLLRSLIEEKMRGGLSWGQSQSDIRRRETWKRVWNNWQEEQKTNLSHFRFGRDNSVSEGDLITGSINARLLTGQQTLAPNKWPAEQICLATCVHCSHILWLSSICHFLLWSRATQFGFHMVCTYTAVLSNPQKGGDLKGCHNQGQKIPSRLSFKKQESKWIVTKDN